MSQAQTAAPIQTQSSFVTTFLKIVGGGAVVVGGAAIVVGAPLIGGAAVVGGAVALGVNYATSGSAAVTDTQAQATQGGTGTTPPDISALKKRMDCALTTLTIYNTTTSKAVAPARAKLADLLAKAEAPTRTADDVERADKGIDAAIKDMAAQMKAAIVSDDELAGWSRFGTDAASTKLPTILEGTPSLGKRLADASASLKNATARLGAPRYVLAKGVPRMVDKGTEAPEVAARIRTLHDLLLETEAAAGTIGTTLAQAKALCDVREKTKVLTTTVATLKAARDAVPATDAELLSKAAGLAVQLQNIPTKRKDARLAALDLKDIKTDSADDLGSRIEAAQLAATKADDAMKEFADFEAADAAEQKAGARVVGNWEAIDRLLEKLDDARRDGKNTGADREITNGVAASRGTLQAATLRDAVAEAVALYKRMQKDVVEAGKRLTPADGKGAAAVAVTADEAAPAYTYVLGATAITHWGDFNDEMQTLIGEIRTGTVALSSTFELSFRSFKNHSQGARRTKVYLDSADMGGGSVMRGYFGWVRDGDVVTVTPLAVTEEHGAHDRVLVGGF